MAFIKAKFLAVNVPVSDARPHELISLVAKKFTLMDIPKRIVTGKLQPPSMSLGESLRPIKRYQVKVHKLAAESFEEIKRFLQKHLDEQSNALEVRFAEHLKSLDQNLSRSPVDQTREILTKTLNAIFEDADSKALASLVQLVIGELKCEIECLHIECSSSSHRLLGEFHGELNARINEDLPDREFHLHTRNGSIVIDLEKVKNAILEEISCG